MQNNEFCFSYDSKNKIATAIRLQLDHMNGGFMPKPYNTLYEDPASIQLGEQETIIIESESWVKSPWYIGTKLYHKTDKSEMEITEVGKTPADYPEYTDEAIPEPEYAYYHDYSETVDEKSGETIHSWVFNLIKYKEDACKRVTTLCVNENYKILPQYKRDNIYAGSPASDGYPVYLQGDAGRQSIAKLNTIYQQIATSKHAEINAEDIISIDKINEIIEDIIFPTEEEVILQIQS